MTTVVGGLLVELRDDTGQFQESMRKNAALVEQQSARMGKALGGAAKSIDELNRRSSNFNPDGFRALAISALRAEDSVKRLELSFYALGAAAGGGFLGTAAVRALADYADGFTNIRNRIRSVVEGRGEQLAAERDILGIAERSRSSLQSTATLYTRIAASSPALAANAANLGRVIETVQKSFQVGGATTQEAQSSAIQLAQALGSGRLQGDELRSILENNIPLARVLAKELAGGDIGKLKTLGSDGELTTERVIAAILKGTQQIDAAFARTSARISDGFTALNNAVTAYVGRADQAFGVSTGLANGLISLSKNFDTVADAAVLAGIAIAGAFVGRRVGGAVSGTIAQVQQVRTAAVAAKDAADAAFKTAAEQAQKAGLSSQISSAVSDDFRSQPVFKQADERLQALRAKAVEAEEKARDNLSKAVDKETAQYLRLSDAQSQSATVSETAQKRRAAAAMAVQKAEEGLTKAIAAREQKQTAFDTSGGDVRRTELQRFYAALTKEVDARTTLADARATQALNQANIAALQRAETVAKSRKDFEYLQAVRGRLAEETGRITELSNATINAGNQLRKAEEETLRAEQNIQGRQATDKERAAIALARANANVEAAQKRVTRAAEAEARAQAAVNDAIVSSEQSKQARIDKIQNDALVARQARVKAEEAANVTSAARRGIDAQIPQSAFANQQKLLKDTVDSANAYKVALEQQASAQRIASDAAKNASGPMAILRAGINGITGVAGSLVSFLGGPWGIAFTAAGAGLAAFASAQAQAAQKAVEYREILDSLTLATERLTQANRQGLVASAGEVIQSQATVQKVIDGLGQSIDNLLERGGVTTGSGILSNTRGLSALFDADLSKLKDGFDSAGLRLGDFLLNLRAAKGDTDKTKAATDEFIAALEKVGQTRPDLAPVVQEFLTAAQAISTATARILGFQAAVQGQQSTFSNATSRKAVYEENPEDIIKRMVKLPEEPPPVSAGPLGKIIGDAFAKSQIAKASTKKAKQTPTQADVQAVMDAAREKGGFLSYDDAFKVVEAQLKGTGGAGGRTKKTPEQTFAEKLARLTEVGKASFFSDGDRELIEKLSSLKADPKLIEQTRNALLSGGGLPAQAEQVRQALELEKAGKAYQDIIGKYGTLEQLAPKFAEKQRILNIAVNEGKISAEQASLAYGEYVASFQEYAWINNVSDAFGSFVESVATGSAKIKDAFKNLLKDLMKIAIQQLVTQPLKNSLTSLLGQFIGTGAVSSGGGFLSSLFGSITGLFGGGGSSLYATTSAAAVKFHGGGRVGSGGTPTSVPLSALPGNIPRYHTGLKTDEMLAVLQRGERVLTSKQNDRTEAIVSGLTNAVEGGGSTPIVVNQTITANGSMSTEEQARFARLIQDSTRAAIMDDMRRGRIR